MLDANVDLGNVEQCGPASGRRFVLKLNHADEGQRIRYGVQLRDGLRNNGAFKQFTSESGVKVYVDVDKNPKRQREETLAKRIIRSIDTKGRKIYTDKRATDSISIRVDGGKLLVRLAQAARDQKPRMVWDNALAKELGINPASLEAKAAENTQKDDESLLGAAQSL